jgi:two-component system capsular synthesis sensor histidine kinase RcsC
VLRVLLVDDETDLVESLAMALEGQCEVLTAKNGAEALDVIAREGAAHIDAIVLDLMMPVMNGEELIVELQKRAITIPVIVASASRNVEAKCEALGVQHCLQKPYRLQKLLDHLKSVSSSRS